MGFGEYGSDVATMSELRDTPGSTMTFAPRPTGSPTTFAGERISYQRLIETELAALELAVRGIADVPNAVLARTLSIVLGAGGKRLRPALVLLASHGNPHASLERRIALATAAELLHTATLVHDDVIDLAASRRGSQTVNHVFGNTLAVLTGDYLFGKSGELVAGLGSPPIMSVFSWAVMELVKGEMLRPQLTDDLAETEREYVAKIRGKTAVLLAMACETGSMLDADDPQARSSMHAYGMSLGMAFQVIDDVLDFTATEAELGKPVGNDLRQGTVTLPSILYMREHPDDSTVRRVLNGGASDSETEHAVDAVRHSKAIESSRQCAARYVAEAVGHLSTMPNTPARRALEALAEFVVIRHD